MLLGKATYLEQLLLVKHLAERIVRRVEKNHLGLLIHHRLQVFHFDLPVSTRYHPIMGTRWRANEGI